MAERPVALSEDAVQRAAEVMLRQYDSQYSATHLTWRDFAGDAREILAAALLVRDTDRPDPQREVPDGYELVAAPDKDWRPVTGKRCRYMSNRQVCGQPAVAEFDRGARYGEGHRENWWAYCADSKHLYGRWVEGGQVMHWILRRKEGSDE